VSGFANMLGICNRTAYRILRRGDVPVVKIGGRTLIAITAVDAFIAAHSRPFIDRSAA
jgi:excisionase family DNA binding protein